MVATVLAGLFLIIMGVFKFGSLIKFIPYTITTGFTFGIAVTIAVGQVKDFTGLKFSSSPITTMEKLSAIFSSISTINYVALAVGVISLAVLIIMPKIKALDKIPPSLIAVILSAAIVKVFDLNVNTIGDLYTISSRLPSIAIPDISFDVIKSSIPDAFTIAVLAAVESLLSCVVSDGMIGDRHNSNMELIAQGAGNIGSALFGGIPATGAIARTAANIKNGGRSPIAGMVHSAVLLIILVVLMPYAALIPMPAIAAILFIVAYNMSGWRECVSLLKTSPKSDVAILLVTLVLTVVFDLVVAIIAGLLLAAILFMKRMADVTEVESWKYIGENGVDADNINLKAVPEGTLVFELNGPMFFGVADKISRLMFDKTKDVLILRMRGVPAMDISALRSLKSLYSDCKKNNITLILSHVNEQPMKVLEKSGFVNEIGKNNICRCIDDAIKRAEEIK